MPNICIVLILSSCLQSIAAAMAVIINIICKTDDRAILFFICSPLSTSITWLKAFCNKCKNKAVGQCPQLRRFVIYYLFYRIAQAHVLTPDPYCNI